MSTLQAVRDYQELRGIWRADPVLYARTRLGINPTRQQQQLLEAIEPFGARVTVRAGHEVGKTTAVSCAILWHLECFDHSKTPCTAPTASQLYQVLWSELAKMLGRADEQAEKLGLDGAFRLGNLFRVVQDRIYDPSASSQWFATARTARRDNPDALQGYHATDLQITEDDVAVQRSEAGGSIMYVIEEASGVPDEIIEVIEGALAGRRVRLLMVGNPTRNTGFFARSHQKDRALFTTLHFRCSDSPLPAADYREKLIRKYGEGSNVVRVRADGEFPSQDDDVLVSLELTEAAINREAPPDDGADLILGVDVARFGDDRTVFVMRKGRRVTYIEVCAKQDTMATAGRAMDLWRRFQPARIKVDVIGIGSGVVDRLKEQGAPVDAVNVAETGSVPGRRATRRSEHQLEERYDRRDALPRSLRDYLWQAAADWLRDEEPSFIEARRHDGDEDPVEVLAAELSTVRYGFDSSGRLVVESKDEMKKRGLRSPDVAEALLMTFAPSGLSIWERLV